MSVVEYRLPPKKSVKYRARVNDPVEVEFSQLPGFETKNTAVVPGILKALDMKGNTATVQLGKYCHAKKELANCLFFFSFAGVTTSVPCIRYQDNTKMKKTPEVLCLPLERLFIPKPPHRIEKALCKGSWIQVAWKHDQNSAMGWWDARLVEDYQPPAKKVKILYSYDDEDIWKRDVCSVDMKFVRIPPSHSQYVGI